MSNFSGLNTGLSALIAHRQAVEVISHNIANVNTPGYTRRRVELQADGSAPVAAVFARGTDTGSGVRSDGITRIWDAFLDAQHRNESGIAATLAGTTVVVDRLEGVFPEPSDNGISGQLNDLWASWQAIVNNPDSEPARSSVLEKGKLVIQALQLSDRQIHTQHDDAVTNVGLMVGEVNKLAEQVARYNTGIRAASVSGDAPNDLLDQRDELVLRLTELTGATVAPGEQGSIDVFVGGRALVHGSYSEKLSLAEVVDPALTPLGFKRAEVQWAADAYPAGMSAGSITGYVSGANDVLPRYLNQVNDVAAKLVTSVNALHRTGKDLDGATGHDFFAATGTTAATIALSADVANQPRHLAAAAAGGGALDTSMAETIAKIGQSASGPDASYRSMIVSLGSEVQFFTQQSEAQQGVVQRLDEDRKSVSGVSLDEEMVNLVASQHAYSAAARVITTVDEMLDTLINRTGVVGR
jgi:flagellar hook-associated protein 1 FlgK